jgi:hypothetical protein
MQAEEANQHFYQFSGIETVKGLVATVVLGGAKLQAVRCG